MDLGENGGREGLRGVEKEELQIVIVYEGENLVSTKGGLSKKTLKLKTK